MKKRIIPVALLVALILSLGLNAYARWSYTSACDPRLTFTGTTANCSVAIRAHDDTAKITATLKLIRENTDGTETTICTWYNLSGTGSLSFSGTQTVTKQQTYRLEVDATVKTSSGTEYPYTYVTVKCP